MKIQIIETLGQGRQSDHNENKKYLKLQVRVEKTSFMKIKKFQNLGSGRETESMK